MTVCVIIYMFCKSCQHECEPEIVLKIKTVIKNKTKTSLKYFQPEKRESSFSIHQISQLLVKSPKLSKVQVTQAVQCPSFPNCQSPSHPKLKSPKAQVTQSISCPNCQKSKLPPSKKNNLLISHGQEYSWPCNSQTCFTMTKQRKMLHVQEYLWLSNSQKY